MNKEYYNEQVSLISSTMTRHSANIFAIHRSRFSVSRFACVLRTSFMVQGFTLIELLVVIAILSILSIIVILVINPTELLKQARDSSRVGDLATINSALNLFQVDSPDASQGTASTTYISIPDNTATSTTQGNQCQGLGLPSLPAGWTYHCSASSTYKNTDGTGWVPVNFTGMSYGNPLGSLPVDPVNTTSSGNYYTYTPGGSWQLTGTPESSKYRTNQANQITGALTLGSNQTLSPIFNPSGLVGYWKFDEGNGASTTDSSGNGNTGSWNGTGSHWTTGKVGSYAGSFDGSTDNVTLTTINVSSTNVSMFTWVYLSSASLAGTLLHIGGLPGVDGFGLGVGNTTAGNSGNHLILTLVGVGHNNSGANIGTGWHFVGMTRDTTTWRFYVDGAQAGSTFIGNPNAYSNGATFGSNGSPSEDYYFNNGYLDDVRIYNRALSAAEIMALYNATK